MSGAPGWHPDPKDPTQVRWFDGSFWTEHTAPAPAAPPTAEAVRWRRPRTAVLVAGGVAAGVVALALLVAAAVPVYHDQRARSALRPFTSMSCDDVAGEAIKLAGVQGELDPLESITSASVVRDNREIMRIPAPGDEEFVMSCAGMGTRPDGSTAPLTIDLYIDHERTHLLWYSWDL